ncbi:MAG: helix-turn-helix transcriptional regulator [Melioribacteraceae bacterium]
MNKNITRYGFKEGFPVEFELTSLSDLYLRHKSLLISPHRTDFYHIIWFQKGSPTHLVDFEPIKIKSNSLLFISKDKVQSFDKSGNFDGKAILFTSNFFCQTEVDRKFLHSTLLYNDILNVSNINLGKSTEIYSKIFDAIGAEVNKPTDGSQQYILKNYLHNLMLHAERERQKQTVIKTIRSSDLDIVQLFKDIVDKNFKSVKSVREYSKQLHIYEKRLNIATTNVFGKPPKKIIDERILLEAKRLLVYSDYSIKEISIELGFDEPTNFIKYFRKHTTTTPLEFRENHQF